MLVADKPTDAAAASVPKGWRSKRWVRWLRRFAKIIAIIYVAISLVLYLIQDRLVFPGHSYQGKPWAQVRESTEFEVLHLQTADGTSIAALFGDARDSNDRPIAKPERAPTVLFFYGNGSSIANSFAEFRMFRRLGCNVCIPEFVGYGMSAGAPSEANCYATADAAYDYLMNRPGIDGTKLVASGWSLGAAVAIDLASRKRVAGLITFSAFSSMNDMGHRDYPWLPTSLFLRSHFYSEQKMKSVTGPMLLIHGLSDTLIPFAMRDALADAAQASGHSVETLAVQSDHVNIFELGGDPMREAIGHFLDQQVRHLSPATRPIKS